MKHRILAWPALLAFLVPVSGCEPPAPGPQGDSHTNWLRTCETDRDCGELSCLCGVCTLPCGTEDTCSATPGATCLPADHKGTMAVCAGQMPRALGLCLPSCTENGCDNGQECVGGACQPLAEPSAHVAVDTSIKLQQLTGFGATIGYSEDEISAFKDADGLSQAMFAGLGLDVLRFRNRYGEVLEPTLSQATSIVASATRSLGRTPLVLLGSWSPPASLKQNGATFCVSNASNCTLVSNAGGVFDYAGLATHWKGSLEAYARVGFVPDYIGIQNNPDWIPSGGAVNEACKFLPTEGSVNVLVNGVSVPVKYPGYDQALHAVSDAIADLPARPRVLAPDISRIGGAKEYLDALGGTPVDAVAHHMYGADAATLDLEGLKALAELGDGMGVPLFQTEMQADGFDTAVLIHHAVVDGGASMYLQTALVGPLSGPAVNPSALLGVEGDSMVLQEAYFAMSHFSRFTEPGWSRVGVSSSNGSVLSSAWLAPAHDMLTVVLVNTAANTQVVSLDLGAQRVSSAKLLRTVFGGFERFADLGAWTATSTISLPPRSVATVVIEE